MVPEDSQNGSSSERNAFEATKWHQMAPGSGFYQTPPSLLELPGDPEGPRKSIKNRLFAKKCVPGVLFLTFFVQISVLLVFFRILYRFFAENQWKLDEHIKVYFHTIACFFWTWRPSRNIVFYDTKATFSVFFFLYFFQKKNIQKVIQNSSHTLSLNKH